MRLKSTTKKAVTRRERVSTAHPTEEPRRSSWPRWTEVEWRKHFGRAEPIGDLRGCGARVAGPGRVVGFIALGFQAPDLVPEAGGSRGGGRSS